MRLRSPFLRLFTPLVCMAAGAAWPASGAARVDDASLSLLAEEGEVVFDGIGSYRFESSSTEVLELTVVFPSGAAQGPVPWAGVEADDLWFSGHLRFSVSDDLSLVGPQPIEIVASTDGAVWASIFLERDSNSDEMIWSAVSYGGAQEGILNGTDVAFSNLLQESGVHSGPVRVAFEVRWPSGSAGSVILEGADSGIAIAQVPPNALFLEAGSAQISGDCLAVPLMVRRHSRSEAGSYTLRLDHVEGGVVSPLGWSAEVDFADTETSAHSAVCLPLAEGSEPAQPYLIELSAWREGEVESPSASAFVAGNLPTSTPERSLRRLLGVPVVAGGAASLALLLLRRRA